MYACKQCGTGNSLDSSFCKKCGTVLPSDDLKEAKTELAALLEEGNTLFTDGRTDEAILIAEMAVQADPSSHVALSLKGLCHDRLGQLAEALECYEAAVAMNPDSTLDKIKVAALRNRLAQHVIAAPEPNRRAAMVMATAAVVLVLVGGAFAGMAASSGHKDSGNVAVNSSPQSTTSTLIPPATPAQGTQTATGTPNSAGPGPASVQPPVEQHTTGGHAVDLSGQDRGPTFPPVTGVTLPDPNNVAPIKVDRVIPEGPKRNDGDPAPSVLNSGGGGPTTADAAQEENPGHIDIQFGPSKGSTITGGSQPVDNGGGAETARRAANNAYQVHNYAEAANHYRQVADMGGDSGQIEQRLGECYGNLGQTGLARAAYNRAITRYEAQIKSGQAVDRAQRGLDSCEQALKVLGG